MGHNRTQLCLPSTQCCHRCYHLPSRCCGVHSAAMTAIQPTVTYS